MTDTNLHAVVTGGTGFLGSAVVSALRARGTVCHVPVFAAAELERFPHRDDPDVRTVVGVDLSDPEQVDRFYADVPPLWASIHLAGGFFAAPIADTAPADLDRMWRMNALTAYLCCRAAVARIRAAGNGGRIVNVAARPALVPTGGMTAYAMTKAAVANLTVSLAEEVAGEGILVNAVAPSMMDTPANRKAMPDHDFTHVPKVDEVAATVAFLASPENRVVRGAVVPVYGRT
ncbi:MAG: SDR family oxidoreductase [Deltaproteobacteria bacterium]|nr:MAG: SDR family oxidoreductase [Deltaproteobacteria bacterium]